MNQVHTVYVLSSAVRKYLYVGMTQDIKDRIFRHNSGRERTTRAFRPFISVHKEIFSDRVAARTREKYLKSGAGKEFLKSFIRTANQ